MSIYKISEVIGEKQSEMTASSTNFMLISYILRREEPLSPELLYSRIDPNESDELDFSNQVTIAEATYNPNYDYYYDEQDSDAQELIYDDEGNVIESPINVEATDGMDEQNLASGEIPVVDNDNTFEPIPATVTENQE